jgi:hypothetical protein
MMAAAAIAMSPDLAGQVRMTGAASAADDLFTKFFERYGRGEITVGALPDEQAREFARELRRTGPPWAGPGNEPDSPRRRLLVATIAIDFINQNFERAWGVGYPGELLEWACELLRGTPPAPAERAWHLAAVALLQRASASRLVRGPVSAATGNTAVVTHIIHAEGRFPGDGEWALARAIDAEHLTWPPALTEDVLRPPPDHENRIRSRMQDAFEVASVRDEARLRWAYFQTRRGRFAQALEEFDDVGPPSDPVVRFWLHLLRGRTLVRMERTPEAVESYRKALAEFPHAQSATLALGAAFVNRGQATAARELVSAFLGSSPGTDPWRAYGSPAQRHWPRLYVELRQAIQP